MSDKKTHRPLLTTLREAYLAKQRRRAEAYRKSKKGKAATEEAQERYRNKPASKKKRRAYDRAREDDRQGRGARERAREERNNRKRPGRKRKKRRTIVGVDGEGMDFYVCRRCKERVSTEGGACAKGGRHVLTYVCRLCDKRGVTSRSRCDTSETGAHELDLSADGHVYTYLAAVDERGRLLAEAHDQEGLTHEACCEMLLSLPRNSLCFGFMFSYDVTKIIEEMPTKDRYRLMRPHFRQALVCKERGCGSVLPVGTTTCPDCGSMRTRKKTQPLDHQGRIYDFFNGSLTVSERRDNRLRSTKVWDCFRFFGCAFVQALRSWSGCKQCPTAPPMVRRKGVWQCPSCSAKLTPPPAIAGASPKDWEEPVATAEQIARIDAMKAKRGAFDVEDPEKVKAYCREECYLLARLMRRLIDAHNRAGIPLQSYHGAGSTATALLKEYEVGQYRGDKHRDLEPELRYAVESAFFGGRFENSAIGVVRKPVHGYDISSAYPFALTTLPCLGCGFWRKTSRLKRSDILSAQKKGGLVLARFRVRPVSDKKREELAWAPLPYRSPEGSITYGTNFSGWAWGPEIAAALEGWPDLVELDGEGWIYEKGKRCKHAPFAFLPAVYRQRNAWGKEGAGIVLKLGMNASYGKLAQSIGEDPPFQSWIWAGMVTATTRGQLLQAIASAKDRRNVLAVATDGIFGLEELPLKKPPYDVGTGDMKKPLGGWEYKGTPEGVFFAKPGLYFSLSREGKGAFVRARGVGRREVTSSTDRLVEGFLAWDRRDPKYAVTLRSRRFYGAKQSVGARGGCSRCLKTWAGVPEMGCPSCRKIGDTFVTSLVQTADGRAGYGTWDLRNVDIAFDPYPKRERAGLSRRGTSVRLRLRDLGGKMSTPYNTRTRQTSPEGEAARAAKEDQLEQPDYDEDLD